MGYKKFKICVHFKRVTRQYVAWNRSRSLFWQLPGVIYFRQRKISNDCKIDSKTIIILETTEQNVKEQFVDLTVKKTAYLQIWPVFIVSIYEKASSENARSTYHTISNTCTN